MLAESGSDLPDIVRRGLVHVIIQPGVCSQYPEMPDFTGLSRILTPFSPKLTPFCIHPFSPLILLNFTINLT